MIGITAVAVVKYSKSKIFLNFIGKIVEAEHLVFEG
jgi:hypothetical protein